MGVSTWSYKPEKCDGDYCPLNCDKCPKANYEDGLPIWLVLGALMNESEDKAK